MQKVKIILRRYMIISCMTFSGLSTTDGLQVEGSHIHCHVALHSTHGKFSAPRHDTGALATVKIRKSCPTTRDRSCTGMD